MLTADTRSAQRELAHQLRPFVARRVPESDVDDVLQDVFVRLQQALFQLRDQDRFGPWLYRVARSAVSETLRQRARHPLAPDGSIPELASATDDGEDPSPLESEVAAYAMALVAHLPSPYREALTMTELEGLTQQAAAQTLGISLSAMKSRVQRGRQKLREMLEACCKIALDGRGRIIDCEPRSADGCECSGRRES